MAYQHKVAGVVDLGRNLRALSKLVGGDEMADSLEDGAWVIALQARRNIVAHNLVESQKMHDETKTRKINQSRVDIVVDVDYGATHEFGLDMQMITSRQRAFFWAKYIEEGDDMWKALALSTWYTIPARPFLRPAIDTHKKEAVVTITASLENKMRRVVR